MQPRKSRYKTKTDLDRSQRAMRCILGPHFNTILLVFQSPAALSREQVLQGLEVGVVSDSRLAARPTRGAH